MLGFGWDFWLNLLLGGIAALCWYWVGRIKGRQEIARKHNAAAARDGSLKKEIED